MPKVTSLISNSLSSPMQTNCLTLHRDGFASVYILAPLYMYEVITFNGYFFLSRNPSSYVVNIAKL